MPDYDLVILGSGPGGYVAAIRAGQLGLKTAIIERDELGGICLNWGCIPSKALLRNAEVLSLIQHADDFGISFENLKYDFGKAIDRSRDVVGKILDSTTVEITDSGRRLSAKNIIIATGTRQRRIPTLPIDNEVVITSRDALELRRVPKRIVIVGGGATGCEFGHIYCTYGAEVTIVELLPRLIPNEDAEISDILERSFRRQGIQITTGASVQGIAVNNGQAKVSISVGDSSSVIDCDKVLVAVGVQGNVDNIGLEDAGIEIENSYIKIDDTMSTNVPGVYAVGDVTGKMLLAHVASAQGVTAVETIARLNPPALDYSLMPRAIYCKPQVASFGLSEEQATEQGYAVKIGRFPFNASGKALALGESEGMVKLVVDAEIGEVLGAHMIGAEVTELLGELAMTRLLEGTTTELGWLVHPHPSISETIKEAALDAEGEAIHI